MGNKRKPGTIVCDATVELNEDVSRYTTSSSLVVLWYNPALLRGLLEIQNKPFIFVKPIYKLEVVSRINKCISTTGMHQRNEPQNLTCTR